jgi:beta-glucosidase
VPITERRLREFFFPPFKKAVEAGCKTIMTAYHTIDGLPCTANKWMIRGLLKDELGFDGFVVTDWDNVGRLIRQQFIVSDFRQGAKIAIEAGNDMIMSTPEFYEAAISIVKSGELDEALLDEAVLRILKAKFALGLFTDEKKFYFHSVTESVLSCEEHLELNAEFTDQTVILLENKNNTLPLPRDIKKISVVGPNAFNILAQYGDWTFFTHPMPDFNRKPESVSISVWDGIRELAKSSNIQAEYAAWNYESDDPCFDDMLKLCEGSDAVIAVIGDDPTLNGEEKDRANLDLPAAQQKMLEALKNAGHCLVVIGVAGKPLIVNWAKDNADAMLWTFCPGMYGGRAVARVLFGDANPSARLPISFPAHVGQLPVYYNQMPGWHGEKYIDLPKEPLYTFGYGLSYSDFVFENLECADEVDVNDADIKISIKASNRSKIDGVTVVQLYFRDMVSSVLSPVKQFKGSQRIPLKAGESKTVTFTLPMDELAIVDHQCKRYVEKGTFKLFAGDSGSYLEKEFNVV